MHQITRFFTVALSGDKKKRLLTYLDLESCHYCFSFVGMVSTCATSPMCSIDTFESRVAGWPWKLSTCFVRERRSENTTRNKKINSEQRILFNRKRPQSWNVYIFIAAFNDLLNNPMKFCKWFCILKLFHCKYSSQNRVDERLLTWFDIKAFNNGKRYASFMRIPKIEIR